ncbi:hypothetical protein PCANC_17210 [Puccinia coronata f. sp. avenae]|uniref:S1 motif domain-containing protein n=1 Tax=Puccinia coronata f. sp. avenae TaxID=200324 RepID=A0A2N5U289_9BASI|nr:hypothetical protein PCANC_17210 [Puccinia coronata f. sp. avenae]
MAKKRKNTSVNGEAAANNTDSPPASNKTKKIKRSDQNSNNGETKLPSNADNPKKQLVSLDKHEKSVSSKDTLKKKKEDSNDQDKRKKTTKTNNKKPTNPPFPTTTEEIDFPRGGGIHLTAYEQAEARRDGAQEAEQHLQSLTRPSEANSRPKKRTLSESKTNDSLKRKGKIRADDNDELSHHIPDAYRIEHLNHKRLIPGIKLAGMIIQVRPLELIVALPGQLVGHVPITEISSYYTERLQQTVEEEEEEESQHSSSSDSDHNPNSLKGLDEMFTVGQWIRCSVVKTTAEITKDNLRVSPLVRSALRVTLTLDPVHINSGIDKSDLQNGMTLTGAVKSIEDRGYIIDLGISVDSNSHSTKSSQLPSNNLTAFVSFPDANKATDTQQDDDSSQQWEVGQIIWCRISKLSENGATCVVSVNEEDVSRSALTAATNIDSILPLHMVSCHITSVIPGQGLNVTFLGFFEGTIHIPHLGCHTTTGCDLSSSFKVGDKLRARVLWDTTPSKSHISLEGNESILEPKIFSLSFLDHVLKLDSPGLPPHLQNAELFKADKIDQLLRYPIGYIFQTVRIFRVDEEWGVYVTCSHSAEGHPIEIESPVAFAHIASISDSFLPSLSQDSGPYKIGTTHKARVTGISPIDGILQLTLQPSVVEQPFLSSEDIPIGALITGTVKKLTPTNLIITIEGGIDAVVWPDHYSDVRQRHPEKKFIPGAKVKARVLHTNPEKDQVVLTLRKALVHSKEMITTYETARVGVITDAIVAKVEEKFMLVEFFGRIKALVASGETDVARGESLKSLFTPGNLIQVKITRVDPEKRHIFASSKFEKPDMSVIKTPTVLDVGDKVTAFVRTVRQQDVRLDLHRLGDEPSTSNPLKGIIMVDILASKYGLSPQDLKAHLKSGDEVKDLVVKRKDDGKPFLKVGYEPSKKPQGWMTGSVRFIHEKTLVLNLRRDNQSSTECYVEGFLPIDVLAKHRKVPLNKLKTQIYIGEVISGLRQIYHDLPRGLLIVGFPNPQLGEPVDEFSYTPPEPESLSISDRVVGKIFKILEKSIVLSLRKEGTEGYATHKGVMAHKQLAKSRRISVEQLRSELKNVIPAIEIQVGDPVIGTVIAIHEKNVVLSLQKEGDENKGADILSQGIISSQVLAGHWKVNEKNLEKKLTEGLKIPKLVVKKTNADKGLVIVGFASAPHPLPPSVTELSIGSTLQCRIGNKDALGVKVTPIEILAPAHRFVIDYTDSTDDYDEPHALKEGSEVTACVIQVDTKSHITYLSVRPSDFNQLTGEPSKSPVKDRPIRRYGDLRIGATVRGFVQKVSDSGLILQVGTNIRAKVLASELFDEDIPCWKSEFRVGQVVSGKITSTKLNSFHVSLRKNPGLPKGVLTWEQIQSGQMISTKVNKIASYGMFLAIPQSTKISGLCHISQIYDSKEEFEKHKDDWSDAYSEGMELRASVISIDAQKKKISFTIKPSVVDPEGNTHIKTQHPDVIEITSNRSDDEDTDDDDDDDDDASNRKHSLPGKSQVDIPNGRTKPPTANIDFAEPSLPLSTGFNWDTKRSAAGQSNKMTETDDEASTDTDDSSEEESATTRPTEHQSVNELEKLLVKSPNSSRLWNRLIFHYIQKADIPQARQTARRALEAIHYREEAEKWKVWISLLDLESTYGTPEQFSQTFNEASVSNDSKTVWLKVADIYAQSGKTEKADETYSQAVKKFRDSSKAWSLYGEFCLKNDRHTQAADLLSRSLKSLPKHKHVKTIGKFTQLEFKFGDQERGRTLFEGLVASYPKRLDLWNVYLDLEIKSGTAPELIRSLFSRMLALKFNSKRMKSIFKKWLSFEQTHGDKESQDLVIQKAQAYVSALISSSQPTPQMDEEESDRDDA